MPEHGQQEVALGGQSNRHPIDLIQEITSVDPFPDTSIVCEYTREDVSRLSCRILAEFYGEPHVTEITFEWDEDHNTLIVTAQLGIALSPKTKIEWRELFLKAILLANREGWSQGSFSYLEDAVGVITPIFEIDLFVDETTEREHIYNLFDGATHSCLHLSAVLVSILGGNTNPEDLIRTAFSYPAGNT